MAHLTHQSLLSAFVLETMFNDHIVNHILFDDLVIKGNKKEIQKLEIYMHKNKDKVRF